MKFFFTLHRCPSEHSRQYEHVYLRLFDAGETRYPCEELFTFRWQGDRDSDHWYGFHLDLSVDSPAKALDRMKHAQSLLRRLMKNQESFFNLERPEVVTAALDQLGIERRVYDDRANTYLLLSEVKGPDYFRWMAWLDGSCVVTTLATTEEEAKAELLKVFAHQVADGRSFGRSYANRLEQWLTQGKPVRLDTHRNPPDLRDIPTLLRPLKAPAPAAVAA